MPPLQKLTATRSRMFRRAEQFKTPEPMAQTDHDQQSAAPAGVRFRLRRRNPSSLSTPPTQGFLESVAAADVPMPSIEGPIILDQDMAEANMTDMEISHDGRREVSLPKTPSPEIASIPSQKHYPADTAPESNAEYDTSRPSTAYSTVTSGASLFSFSSDEGSTFEDFLSDEDVNRTIKAYAPANSRRAPWTRAMRQHLWSTYEAYLEDPQVTPIRFGKSNMPPQGVLSRVARAAKKSWKGPKPLSQSNAKAGRCTTPTARDYVFLQWPHTHAATRIYLRDLCRARAGSTVRNGRYIESSLTPFGRTAGCRSRRSPGIFSGSDMALSLAVSTSESMQPQGPLAQLTRSTPQQQLFFDLPSLPIETSSSTLLMPPAPLTDESRTRLGSPFVAAKSYGPSASLSLSDALANVPEQRTRSNTVGARRNSASARTNRSRSNTTRRRPRQAELEQRRARRPSLPSDMWCEPPHASTPNPPSSDIVVPGGSLAPTTSDALFPPLINTQRPFETAQPATPNQAIPKSDEATPQQDTFEPMEPCTPTPRQSRQSQAIVSAPPPRLGSPFAAAIQNSFSFPNRLLGLGARGRGLDFGAIRRPFASVHQSAAAATNDGSPRSSLTRRLAYLDERLKDFRQRSPSLRRSESPL